MKNLFRSLDGGGGTGVVSFSNNRKAFTLAEVLVTIGIIGVVASLTMPTLMQNSGRKETSARLKKFYSVFSQAIIQSELDHGMSEDWSRSANLTDEDEDAAASKNYDETVKFWNKYFAPYIKTLRIEKGTGEDTMYSSRAIVYLADGTSIAIWNGGCMSMIFDANADKSPNKLGSDRFGFEFCHKKSERATYLGENIDFGPDGLIDANSRDKAVSMCKESPIKCATLLIKYDNYEFEDDYPW